MSTIVTRSGKGSPLTHNEVDTNFTNLNTDKVEKTAAAITGGTIDNTTIGATTPSTGVFTTLTATGQTSLGGAAGSEGLRVNSVAGSTNWLDVTGSNSNRVDVTALGPAGSNVALRLSSRGSQPVNFYTIAQTALQFSVSSTVSAVNYVQVTGAATGGTPTISFQGSDSTISGQILTKGAGAFSFYNNGGSNRQLRIDGAVSAVNFLGIAGAVAGNAPILSVATQSSDTNSSLAIQSKGTGAINLAAGSSGVNISNGGTVTAITRTAAGTFYTSIPTLTISPPTTAGGVQATATPQMAGQTVTVQAAGTGYVVGNTLTVVGGTSSTAAQLRVDSIDGSGGVTATSFVNTAGAYSVLPTNPVSVTGGAGSGATFNITQWFFASVGPIITNAGSGYVEQPTVTFSGGGGSGAAAFAVVGFQSIIKGIGTSSGTISNQSIMFQTPSGNALLLRDSNQATPDAHLMVQSTANGYALALAEGSNANASLYVGAKGAGSIRFNTQSTSLTEQMRVTNTTSAVNYVQVTGAATGGNPYFLSAGSDSNIGLVLASKGTGAFGFWTNGGANQQFSVTHTASAVNRIQVTGNIAGAAPSMSAVGSDTNIDLALTPKGTGNVRFGTYTASMALTVQGYIEIKDAGGTIRRLAVVA